MKGKKLVTCDIAEDLALSITPTMYRIPRRENSRLEAMIDARDHLRVRISLLADKPDDVQQVLALSAELTALDREIMRLEAAERLARN